MCGFNRQKPQMIIYAKLQCSHVRHQYGIFGGKSQTSFSRNATRAGSEEGRLFSQAKFSREEKSMQMSHSPFKARGIVLQLLVAVVNPYS